ncbi:MAG: hypothetical protein M3317_06050 [Actinomycetota bacterium]|nr:hypothetical protein [Actinomycetota bacterium]
MNRSRFGFGLDEAEALLGDGLEVVDGAGLLEAEEGVGLVGVGLADDGLMVVVGKLPLLWAAAGVAGSATWSHVVRATAPATSTNTTTAANFNGLVPILGRIVRYSVRSRYPLRFSDL